VSDSLIKSLTSFLGEIRTLSLATVDEEGRPHAANLYFAPDDDLNLYFTSSPKCAHCRHIMREPHVAATAYAPVKMWQQIKGVQLHGLCEPTDPGEFAIVWEIYLRKFPYIAEVQELVRSQTFYRLKPSWFRWIDNTVRFGHKVETDWPRQGGA
jgi:uncharacterized protein YhbP (UPF0306 family)